MTAELYDPTEEDCKRTLLSLQNTVALCVNQRRTDLLTALQACMGQMLKNAAEAVAAGKEYRYEPVDDERTLN